MIFFMFITFLVIHSMYLSFTSFCGHEANELLDLWSSSVTSQLVYQSLLMTELVGWQTVSSCEVELTNSFFNIRHFVNLICILLINLVQSCSNVFCCMVSKSVYSSVKKTLSWLCLHWCHHVHKVEFDSTSSIKRIENSCATSHKCVSWDKMLIHFWGYL